METLQNPPPEGEPENVTPATRWGIFGPCPVYSCYAATGNPCQSLGVQGESIVLDLPHTGRPYLPGFGPDDEAPVVPADIRHFAGLADAYTVCGLERATVRWTDDPATPVDCPTSTAVLVDEQLAEVPVCLAASRHGGICGQPAPCDGSLHRVEPTPGPERRTVSLEVLTDELRAVYCADPIPAEARVGVVLREHGAAVLIADTDLPWTSRDREAVYTLRGLLSEMISGANRLERDDHRVVELLMPTPDVLAALAGEPVGTWTVPVEVVYRTVQPGWLLESVVNDSLVVEQVLGAKTCTDPQCANPGDCVELTLELLTGERARGAYEFVAWHPVYVRIPADQAVTR